MTRKWNALAIVRFVVVGMLVGASGTYFFERGFHLSGAALLGVAGVVVGVAISAVFKCSKLDRSRRARTRSNTGQIRAWWDYRPRHGIQRRAETQRAEPVDALSVPGPATHIDDAVWFDFIPIESAATDEPTNSPAASPTTKVP